MFVKYNNVIFVLSFNNKTINIMRTIEITQEIYSFKDLEINQELKAKVLEKYANINVDVDWSADTIINFKELSNIMGIEIDKIYFSGFHSQGDGYSFVGFYSYKGKSVEELKRLNVDERLISIASKLQEAQKKCRYTATCFIGVRHHHYVHENTMNFRFEAKSNIQESKMYNQGHVFEESFKELAKYFYSILEMYYEYLTSDEAILSTLESNEYEFTSDGKIF